MSNATVENLAIQLQEEKQKNAIAIDALNKIVSTCNKDAVEVSVSLDASKMVKARRDLRQRVTSIAHETLVIIK